MRGQNDVTQCYTTLPGYTMRDCLEFVHSCLVLSQSQSAFLESRNFEKETTFKKSHITVAQIKSQIIESSETRDMARCCKI